MKILGVVEPSEFENLNEYVQFLVYNFSNVMGNFQVPKSEFWKNDEFMTCLIYFVWMAFTFLLHAIFLNYLIAYFIVSYETVIDTQMKNKYMAMV